MDVEEKIDLVCKHPTQEVIKRDELRELFESHSKPKHYIGLEVSGLLHLGSLVVVGRKINDLLRAGVECTVFLADWHSVINNKLGGDWQKILNACEYYQEAFEFYCPGVKTVLGSDLYKGNDEYWRDVVLFSKRMTLARATRCLTIMGRTEKEKLDLAQYFYPSMQAVDIHALGVQIAHAGMDQRKVHVLAREAFPKMRWKKPIALHTLLLPGLMQAKRKGFEEDARLDQQVSSKMSKSIPASCVFVHDSLEEIQGKMRKAFCPERVVEGNPVLELVKLLVFPELGSLEVKREQKFGGATSFESFDELEKAFKEGVLHPVDLKNAVALAIDKIVGPVRKHFENKEGLLKVYEKDASR